MEIFIKITQFILSLSILIVLHELGHFIPAKLFKTRVEKFYLFFDYKFSIFKKKIRETEYGIGWIPLGGYVKISGMIDESMDVDQMKSEPKPWEFRSKPAWQRLIIMLGGVTVNFILAFVIYMMILFVWGQELLPKSSLPNGFHISEQFEKLGFQQGDQILEVNGKKQKYVPDINKLLFLRNLDSIKVLHSNGQIEIIKIPKDIGKEMFELGDMLPFTPFILPVLDTLMPGLPAEKAGVKIGERIIKIDGKPTLNWDDVVNAINDNTSKKPMNFELSYNDELRNLIIAPNNEGKIGFGVKMKPPKTVVKKYSLGESLTKGSSLAVESTKDYLVQFKYIFSKKGAQSVGGFISIGSIFPEKWDWLKFWEITAILSVMLAVMNLLPIPALDGGHVMFTLYEIITRRKPSDKFMEYAQITGFVILIGLLLYANGNDIFKMFFK